MEENRANFFTKRASPKNCQEFYKNDRCLNLQLLFLPMTLTSTTYAIFKKKPLLFIHPLLKQKRYISSLILLSPTSKIVHRLIYITCVWNTTLLFYSSNLKTKNWIFIQKNFAHLLKWIIIVTYWWWWYFCYTIWRKDFWKLPAMLPVIFAMMM